MEENTQLSDLFAQLFPEEEDRVEASQWSFSTEGQIDDAIESVKELEEDENRFKALYKEKADKLKFELDSRLLKIDNKKDWILFNLKNSVKAAKDKKETKTQFKKSYLSGDIIIKKAATKLLKPELTEEEIETKFPNYKKEKTEITLDWAALKTDLKIVDGKVICVPMGKDVSTLISTEVTSESVSVK